MHILSLDCCINIESKFERKEKHFMCMQRTSEVDSSQKIITVKACFGGRG
jgi:hypothetical protein